MSSTISWFRVMRLFGFMLLFLAALLPQNIVQAAGTTFYIDNRSGSNCSNAGTGTSASAPWCDFTNVNNRTFGLGDQVLLARGATWNQQMTLNGSGAAGNEAILDAYGSGDRPKIIRNGVETDRAIRMNNLSHWRVSNLEIGNAAVGILVFYTTLFHEGLVFNNLFLHDIRGIHQGNRFTNGNINCTTTDKVWNSAGIEITGSVTAGADDFVLKGVTIDTIEGTHNQASISFDWCNGEGSSAGSDGNNLVQNVTLNRLYLHDDNGPAEGCDEGLRLVNMRNVIIMNSRLINEASCYSSTGTAAIIFGRLRNVTFVNSIVTDVPDTGSTDQGGFDYEYGNDLVRIQNSYIARNAGPGVEFLAIYDPPNHMLDNEIDGNVFVNNSFAQRGEYRGGIGRVGNRIVPTGVIRDNLYYEPTGFTYGDFSGFTFQNNRAAVSDQRLYYAGEQWSNTQGSNGWRYQSSPNGTNWSDLNYDTSTDLWKPNPSTPIPLISRFEMHPEVCSACWVARGWQAPVSGVISIRSRALKSDIGGGDGVVVRVTKNGTVIWGPQTVAYNDRSGVVANLDAITVATGDVIRFELANNGNNAYDLVSWSPGIGYTELSGVPIITNLGFETPTINTYSYGPISSASWTLENGAGIQRNGSAFGGPNAPQGAQVAFLQGGAACFSQSLSGFVSGTTYTLTFAAAQRSGSLGGQTIKVFLDSTELATHTPSGNSYIDTQISGISTSSGSHTLKFCGTVTGDHTAFVDNIRITN